MSAGSEVERAYLRASRAVGRLCVMVVFKRIGATELRVALNELEEAVTTIRSVLTTAGGGTKLENSDTPKES